MVIYYTLSLLLYLPLTIIVTFYNQLTGNAEVQPWDFVTTFQSQVISVTSIILAIILAAYLEWRQDRTLGKDYMKLKIESEFAGNSPSLSQIIWRHIIKLGLIFINYKILDTVLYQNSIDFVYNQIIIFLSFALSGIFVLIFVLKGRFLHEIISRTKVVDTQVTFDKKS